MSYRKINPVRKNNFSTENIQNLKVFFLKIPWELRIFPNRETYLLQKSDSDR